MLPSMRQRLFIVAAGLIGGLVLMYTTGAITPYDASSGPSLFDAQSGAVYAILLLVLTAGPVLVLSMIVSAAGNPLAGVFSLSFALMLMVAQCGPIDGFLWRSKLPGDYLWLIIEVMIWILLIVLFLMMIQRFRPAIRKRLPAVLISDHLGDKLVFKVPGKQAMLAGLISAGIGGLLSNLMIQSTDVGQVNGSLILAFAIAAMISQMIISQPNPTVVLLSPLIAGLFAYASIWLISGYSNTETVLAAWYRNQLPGLALALPVHYISAGLMGTSIGMGLAQSYERAKTHVVHA